MIQVDYEFYRETYAGTLIPDEKAFKQPVLKANIYLDQKLHRIPDERNKELVQLCICEVAEMLYQDIQNRMETGGREIQSENTDGYSVTYATEAEAGKIAINSLQTKIYQVIRRYLGHTGLLYAGVDRCADKCCHYNL